MHIYSLPPRYDQSTIMETVKRRHMRNSRLASYHPCLRWSGFVVLSYCLGSLFLLEKKLMRPCQTKGRPLRIQEQDVSSAWSILGRQHEGTSKEQQNRTGTSSFGQVEFLSCNEYIMDFHMPAKKEENDILFTDKKHIRMTNTGTPFWMSIHDASYDPMRWKLYERGFYYEQVQSRAFVDIISKAKSPKVVDVGGNIGWFSLLSASEGAEVMVFEPNRANCLRMCESICMNEYEDAPCESFRAPIKPGSSPAGRIWVSSNGISDRAEEVMFTMPTTAGTGKNPGEAKIITKSGNIPDDSVTSIRTVSLDMAIEERGWKTIDILKLDVEGHEKEAILGASQILRNKAAANIFLEGDVAHRNKFPKFKELMGLLLDAGYVAYKYGAYSGPSHEIPSSALPKGDRSGLLDALLEICRNDHGKRRSRLTKCNLWWRPEEEITIS